MKEYDLPIMPASFRLVVFKYCFEASNMEDLQYQAKLVFLMFYEQY